MKEESIKLSSSLEDYLKVIYIHSQKSESVRVTDIAESMSISKPSVNRAMKTLMEMGYLKHEHYGDIFLTDIGKDTAKNILESYKALYKFLTDVLGVDDETAAKEADLMEHAISKGTRKKLKKFVKKSK